jgi:NTP pyrophosphatase (non-canonical NTP hydrolase)
MSNETTHSESISDDKTQIQTLKNIVGKFCEERDWDRFHSPKDLAVAIITEAAELLEIFRFKTPEDMKHMLEEPDKRRDIADELSDVFYFILRFSQLYGIDISSEFIRKMGRNTEKYPVDKFKGSNRKYTEV